MTPCPKCGRPVEAVPGEPVNVCTWCGMSQTEEAPGDFLERMLAKDAGTTPDDPRFRASIARLREQEPEEWNALVQKLRPPAKE